MCYYIDTRKVGKMFGKTSDIERKISTLYKLRFEQRGINMKNEKRLKKLEEANQEFSKKISSMAFDIGRGMSPEIKAIRETISLENLRNDMITRLEEREVLKKENEELRNEIDNLRMRKNHIEEKLSLERELTNELKKQIERKDRSISALAMDLGEALKSLEKLS